MKNILMAFFFSLVVVATAAGETKSVRPQASFGIEGNEIGEKRVAIPAKLPNEVIQLLRSDEDCQRCFEGGTEGEIPPVWLKAFEASEIDLNGDRLQDLIVLPTDGCLFGANIAPFWVFLRTPKGYKMALNVYAHNLDVLKTRTNGYRDLESTSASAVEVFSTLFMFDGKQYVVKKAERTPID